MTIEASLIYTIFFGIMAIAVAGAVTKTAWQQMSGHRAAIRVERNLAALTQPWVGTVADQAQTLLDSVPRAAMINRPALRNALTNLRTARSAERAEIPMDPNHSKETAELAEARETERPVQENDLCDTIRSLGLNSEDAQDLKEFADIRVHLGDNLQAVLALRMALIASTGEGAAFHNCSVAAKNLGEPQLALELSERAHELDPNDAQIHATYAEGLSSVGRVVEAENEFQDLLGREGPLGDWAYVLYVRSLVQREEYVRARQIMEEALEKYPKSDPVATIYFEQLRDHRIDMGATNETVEMAGANLIDVNPEDPMNWAIVASYLAQNKSFDMAKTYFAGALAHHLSDSVLIGNCAAFLADINEKDLAVQLWGSVLAPDPYNNRVWRQYLAALRQIDRVGLALQLRITPVGPERIHLLESQQGQLEPLPLTLAKVASFLGGEDATSVDDTADQPDQELSEAMREFVASAVIKEDPAQEPNNRIDQIERNIAALTHDFAVMQGTIGAVYALLRPAIATPAGSRLPVPAMGRPSPVPPDPLDSMDIKALEDIYVAQLKGGG